MEDELNKQNADENVTDDQLTQKFQKLVTADGTYATQSALTSQTKGKKDEEQKR